MIQGTHHERERRREERHRVRERRVGEGVEGGGDAGGGGSGGGGDGCGGGGLPLGGESGPVQFMDHQVTLHALHLLHRHLPQQLRLHRQLQ